MDDEEREIVRALVRVIDRLAQRLERLEDRANPFEFYVCSWATPDGDPWAWATVSIDGWESLRDDPSVRRVGHAMPLHEARDLVEILESRAPAGNA